MSVNCHMTAHGPCDFSHALVPYFAHEGSGSASVVYCIGLVEEEI